MRNKRIRKIQIFVILLTSFLMFGSVTFAWYAKVEQTDIIKIESASLKVDAKLYFAGNDNSNPFNLVSDQLAINEILPGEVFYFKLIVKNEGTIKGNLSVKIGEVIPSLNLDSGLFTYIVDDTVTDIDFINDNILLNSKELDVLEVYEFYFQIGASGLMTEEYQGESLRINSIIIKIDQIRPWYIYNKVLRSFI